MKKALKETTFLVSKSVLAEMFGISERTIERLTQNLILLPITEPRKGVTQKFDLQENVKRYIVYLNEQKNKKDREYSDLEKRKLKEELSVKSAKAIITNLEAKELQGKMHRSEDVANMTEDLVYTIRGMLIALPGRLAIDAAALTDPAEVSAFIRREVYQVMEELSHYRYDSKKYEERVRERRNWENSNHPGNSDEES